MFNRLFMLLSLCSCVYAATLLEKAQDLLHYWRQPGLARYLNPERFDGPIGRSTMIANLVYNEDEWFKLYPLFEWLSDKHSPETLLSDLDGELCNGVDTGDCYPLGKWLFGLHPYLFKVLIETGVLPTDACMKYVFPPVANASECSKFIYSMDFTEEDALPKGSQ